MTTVGNIGIVARPKKPKPPDPPPRPTVEDVDRWLADIDQVLEDDQPQPKAPR